MSDPTRSSLEFSEGLLDDDGVDTTLFHQNLPFEVTMRRIELGGRRQGDWTK